MKSVKSRVTTINANAPGKISMEAFREALKQQVFIQGDIRVWELSEEEDAAVKRLAQEKYSTWDWNYGFFPKYSIFHEKKFEAGLVTVSMEAEHSVISKIRISGDFFGNREISELEVKLVGLRLDSSLAEKLEQLELEEYMHGITPAQLSELLK